MMRILYPGRGFLPGKVRAFVDFVKSERSGARP